MPRCGGWAGAPRKCGGGYPRAKAIAESILAQMGDAYTSDPDSIVAARNGAVARAVAAAWGTNARLANIDDPMRSELLARQAAIYNLPIGSSTPLRTVRQRWQAIEAARGVDITYQDISERAQMAAGPCFVALEKIDVSIAHVTGPAGSGFTVSPTAPWSSSACKWLVRLQKPPGYSEAQFYLTAGAVIAELGDHIPAAFEIAWYRPGNMSTAVPGGPSAAGFYLDTLRNLDNQVLGS